NLKTEEVTPTEPPEKDTRALTTSPRRQSPSGRQSQEPTDTSMPAQRVHRDARQHERQSDKTLRTLQQESDRIPTEYLQKYSKIFQEELVTGLPRHEPWDHAIDLKEGAVIKRQTPYRRGYKEQQASKEYTKA